MNGSVEEAKLQREQNPGVLIGGFVKSIQYYITRKGRDSSVSIVTRYRLDNLDMKSRLFRDFPHMSQLTLGPTQPQLQLVHSVEPKSISLKFSKSRTGSHVTYSCHHKSSRFTFPGVRLAVYW
jgi:hypothetical protein